MGFRSDSLTINWRGVVAESSAKELVAFEILKNADFKINAYRTLIDGTIERRTFQRMTTSKKVRKGIG